MKLKLFEKVLSFIFIVLVLLALLEFFTALFVAEIKPYPDDMYGHREYPATESDYLPFTLAKNMVFNHSRNEFSVIYPTNGLGYIGRNPLFVEKEENIKRIIFLGDSFTLGWGNNYEDSFVGLLDINLKDDGIEVINAAYRAGYSPDSYYAYLIRDGIKLNPDTLVVGIYTGNDVEDMQTTVWDKVDDLGAPLSLFTLREYTDYNGKILNGENLWYYNLPILRNSRFFIAFFRFVDKKVIKEFKVIPYEEAFEKFKTSIKAIDVLARKNDIDLIFVLIPMKPSQCDEQCLDKHLSTHNFVGNLNRTTIDLSKFLDDGHYYELDGHLNSNGNRVVFGVLNKELEMIGKS